MKKGTNMKQTSVILMALALMLACVVPVAFAKSASEKANEDADNAMYKPVAYANQAKQGPKLVVIPGEIKSNNATFTQKITDNNIADFAELELGKANFGVLERADLGPMLKEMSLAANMGDKDALSKFRKGKFQTTKWLVRFDVLKAEPVAAAKKGFSGRAIGNVLGAIGTRGTSIGGAAVDSVGTENAAGIWIVGMRYKVIDAESSDQVATNYFEGKMELGSKKGSVLGFSSEHSAGVTLDTMVQRLVQMCVADIDGKK
jgi:hypothetical protein